MNRTAVVTISSREPTEPYYFHKQFKASAAQHDIAPIYLDSTNWRGLMTKPKSLLAWIEKEGAAYDYVLSLDAWDMIFVTGIEAIIAKFKGIDAPIVFNAERSCFPRADLAEKHPVALSPYRFLNSGFILGKTDAIIDMLRGMNLDSIPDDHVKPDGSKWEPNDQSYFMEWFIANQSKAALDSQAFICQSLHEAGPDEFTQMPGYANRIVSSVTGNFPAVFHGNGSGKAWLKKIMEWQGFMI